MNVTDTEILNMMEAWLWPFFRIGGLFLTMPMVGSRTVPMRLRLILAISITIAVAPVIPDVEFVEPFSSIGLTISIQQLLIGAALGLVVRIVFMVLEMGGEVIAMQMGLGFAAMIDPASGRQVPVISQFYVVLATLLFFTINGHLILIEVVVDSFKSMPIGIEGVTRADAWSIVNWGGWLLSQAVLMALPAITAMMIVNLSFGVITRAAPQMNIFAVGFPIMMIMGMFVIALTLSNIQDHIADVFMHGFSQARNLIN